MHHEAVLPVNAAHLSVKTKQSEAKAKQSEIYQ